MEAPKPLRVQNSNLVIYKDLPSSYPEYSFSEGIYCGLNVLILNEFGYINATKLCASSGIKAKKFGNWVRSVDATSKIDYYNGLDQFRSSPVSIDLSDLTNDVRGTYMHPRLIIHVACWVSNEFGDKVSCIVEDYATREARNLIREKDKEIDRLYKMMKKNHNLLQDIRMDNEDALDTMKVQHQELVYEHKVTQSKLNHIVPQRVVPVSAKDQSTFVVIHLDTPSIKKGISYTHYAIRGKTDYTSRVSQEKPGRIIYRKEDPNAQAYFDLFKSENEARMFISGNYFSIPGISDRRLLRELNRLEDQKEVIRAPVIPKPAPLILRHDDTVKVSLEFLGSLKEGDLEGYNTKALSNIASRLSIPGRSKCKTKPKLVKLISEFNNK